MKSARFLLAILLALVLTAPWPAHSQETPGMKLIATPSIPDANATSTSNQSHSISFDVVTVDKAGAPVTGLKPEDFTVFDNSQRQTIASVQAVGITSGQEKLPSKSSWLSTPSTPASRQ